MKIGKNKSAQMTHGSFSEMKSTLRDFASSTEPGAMLLRGEWGAGKTYACKQALEGEGIDRIPFSYVSLYGVGSLDDIYSRIAVGWTNSVTHKVPDWMKEVMGGVGKKAFGSLADLAKFHDLNLGGIIQAAGSAAMGLLARNALVVIDDLERRDPKLSINAALGVISYLVEARNCRVIFISNDNEIKGTDKLDFDQQKEKVFDFEFSYNPTVKENASLFPSENSAHLLPPLEALKVRNIRVIRRANKLLSLLRAKLVTANQRANEYVLKNAAMLGVLHYGFRSQANLSDRKSTSEFDMMRLMRDEPPELSDSNKLFQKVGYFAGPADDEIVEYLETGVIDWDKLNEKLANQEQYLKREEIREKVSALFDKCYDNFATPLEEVAVELKKLCEEHAELIEPNSLQRTAIMLQKLAKGDYLEKWLTRWADQNIPLLAENDFHHALDPTISPYPEAIRVRIREEANRRKGKLNIQDVLLRRFSAGGSYAPGDLQQIAEMPLEDLRNWLEKSDNPHVRSIIIALFQDHYGKTGPEAVIAQKVLEALEATATTSRGNQIRLEAFKTCLPKPQPSVQ